VSITNGKSRSAVRDLTGCFDEKDLFDKIKKLLHCIQKFRTIQPPSNYESKLQNQILEFDMRNVWGIVDPGYLGIFKNNRSGNPGGSVSGRNVFSGETCNRTGASDGFLTTGMTRFNSTGNFSVQGFSGEDRNELFLETKKNLLFYETEHGK
jgi:hypothetical protein